MRNKGKVFESRLQRLLFKIEKEEKEEIEKEEEEQSSQVV